MTNSKTIFSILTLAALNTLSAEAAVKLTAMQIISTEANGKIQGVGAHRFKTTQHGGHPAIFLVKGDKLDDPILNGPDTRNNGIELDLDAGTHTYTIYAEK